MAAQPKKKISHVRGKTRRAHSAVKLANLPKCPNCHQPKPGHIVCPECGFYGKKKILTTKTDRQIAKQLHETKKAEAAKAAAEKKAALKPKKSAAKKPVTKPKKNPEK